MYALSCLPTCPCSLFPHGPAYRDARPKSWSAPAKSDDEEEGGSGAGASAGDPAAGGAGGEAEGANRGEATGGGAGGAAEASAKQAAAAAAAAKKKKKKHDYLGFLLLLERDGGECGGFSPRLLVHTTPFRLNSRSPFTSP